MSALAAFVLRLAAAAWRAKGGPVAAGQPFPVEAIVALRLCDAARAYEAP